MDDDELSPAELSDTKGWLGTLSRNKSTNEASKKKETVMFPLHIMKQKDVEFFKKFQLMKEREVEGGARGGRKPLGEG